MSTIGDNTPQSLEVKVELLRSSQRHTRSDLRKVDENFAKHDARLIKISEEQIRQAGLGEQTILNLQRIEGNQRWMSRGLIVMLLTTVATLIKLLIP